MGRQARAGVTATDGAEPKKNMDGSPAGYPSNKQIKYAIITTVDLVEKLRIFEVHSIGCLEFPPLPGGVS